MAQLPPNTAIFSPSVARQAASTAKDWNYVDGWLAARFAGSGRSAPSFERNADTLRALLALAALNEAADEERDLVARAEADALRAARAHAAREAEAEEDEELAVKAEGEASGGAAGPTTVAGVRRAVLAKLEASLSREGRTALDALAQSGVALGLAGAGPERIAQGMAELQARLCDTEQAAARVEVLQQYVDGEGQALQQPQQEEEQEEAAAKQARDNDDGDDPQATTDLPLLPAADLARQNLELQRRVKAGAGQLPELRDKVAALAPAAAAGPTIEQVRAQEDAFMARAAAKRALDNRLAAFEGLPADTRLARRELEAARQELHELTRRRDTAFEGLVERETPRRPRRRP